MRFTARSEEKNTSLLRTIGDIATGLWCIMIMQDDYMDIIGRTTQEIKSSNCRMPTQSVQGSMLLCVRNNDVLFSCFSLVIYLALDNRGILDKY